MPKRAKSASKEGESGVRVQEGENGFGKEYAAPDDPVELKDVQEKGNLRG